MRRDMVKNLSIHAIPHTDLHLVKIVQHVEFGDGHLLDAIDPYGVVDHHRIEPAASSRSPGCGPVFPSLFTDPLSDLILQFGWKRPPPPPRGIALCHPIP